MSTPTTAAAERLRLAALRILGDTSDAAWTYDVPVNVMQDAKDVARAYLALAPAEDEQVAIDKAFVATIAQKCARDGLFAIDVDDQRTLLLRFNGYHGHWMVDLQDCDQRVRLANVCFRGDLRRLCASLSIPLASDAEQVR